MRLLIVTQYFWPENFRINDLAAHFQARGHIVTILTGWPNYPEGKVFDDFLRNPSQFSEFQDAKIFRIPMRPRGRGRFNLFLNYLSFAASASTLGVWKLRGKKFDAVLVYEPSPVTVGIPGAVLGWIKRAPVAMWVLDLWPESLKAVGVITSDRYLKIVGYLVSWIYKRCDLLLAQSKSFTNSIAQYAPKGAWIEYFPAWTDEIFNADRNTDPAPEISVAPDVFTIMFAGNIGEAQDFPAILAAAALLRAQKNLRWIIVGDGRAANWVLDQLKSQRLTDQVLMVGRHPVERMPAFFAHADALLVSLKSDPTFEMTIPGKLQAYLGAGLPILAMLDGEGARIVKEAGAGLVSPAGQGQSLANNVMTLAAMDKKERLQMGENGRRFSAAHFDRITLMDRLESWMEEMAKGMRNKRSK